MPVKWKIFLALNFVLSLPAFVCLILLFINFLNTNYRKTGEDYLYVFLFLFTLLAISVNGFLNIYLLQRFFPDKLLPAGIKRLTIIALVINILGSIGILIFCFYVGSLVFSADYRSVESGGRITIVIISFFWLIQLLVLVMQGQLPGLISRNNRKKMDSLIDSIGK